MSSNPTTQLEQDNVSASDAKHLSTDHLLHNIGQRAVSGGVVTVGAQAATFVLTFAGTAILARLLPPTQFGLIGMVLGVTNLLGIFQELGLSTATVQRQQITQQQVSNLFWINVVLAGMVSLTSCALAPLVARFYHDSRITEIMLALSLISLLTGSALQHRALLSRQMRFSSIAVIDVTSLFVGLTTACLLARAGFGYWALVAQQLATAGACLLLTWSTSKWRPNWPRANSGVRPLLYFGAHLTAADFLGRLSVNTDTVLIGKFFGAEPLGLYNRASVLLARPLQQVFTPINAVMDPLLARLQSDPARYRQTFLHTFDALTMIIFPFAAICLALSRPLVLVILGPKWAGAIPLFSALALVAVSSPLQNVAPWLYQSQGRGADQLRNHSIAGVITVLAYAIGLIWGPLGLILALAITSAVIRLPIVFYIAGRSGPVSTKDLWYGFLPQLPLWGTVYIATLLARIAFANSSPIFQLLVCAPVGLLLGIAILMPFRHYRESAGFAFNMAKDTFNQVLKRA